jgi:asparagine synthetase B (glutamine-hydrolysing)
LIIFIDASSFIISYLILVVIPFNLAFTQYEEYGEEFVDMLDGMFSFVLLDTRDKTFIAARDAIGICPLYMGWGLDGMYSE